MTFDMSFADHGRSGGPGGAVRTTRSALDTDLPRLRIILSTYARCIAELVTELSGAPAIRDQRLRLLDHLHREHETALADLTRTIAMLEAESAMARAVGPAAGRDGFRSSSVDDDQPVRRRQQWIGGRWAQRSAGRRRRALD